jgi:hypothetical protein
LQEPNLTILSCVKWWYFGCDVGDVDVPDLLVRSVADVVIRCFDVMLNINKIHGSIFWPRIDLCFL